MASNLVHHGQSFDDQPLGFGTLAIHLGNGVDAGTGAIRRPITLANTYALPYDASALAIAKHLESLDVVRFVAYPGLESHLHHEVAASQLAARTPGSAACCRSASTPTTTGTTDSFPSSM